MRKKKNRFIPVFLIILLVVAIIISCDPHSMIDIMGMGKPGIFNESRFNDAEFGP